MIPMDPFDVERCDLNYATTLRPSDTAVGTVMITPVTQGFKYTKEVSDVEERLSQLA